MVRLFIGQRVRILYSKSFPEISGLQGRIIGNDVSFAVSRSSQWQVAPDLWGSDLSPNGAGRFAPNSSQLEPILPEGAQPSEFSFTELMDNLGVVVA